jgi:hypothetical protein
LAPDTIDANLIGPWLEALALEFYDPFRHDGGKNAYSDDHPGDRG